VPLRRRGAGVSYHPGAARALAASLDAAQAQWAASVAVNGAMSGDGGGSS